MTIRQLADQVAIAALLLGSPALALAANETTRAGAPDRTATPQAAWTAKTLIKRVASNPMKRARFVELRQLSEFDIPLQSSGELHATPPSRLEKRTLKPIVETMVIDGQSLQVTTARRTFDTSLDESPELAELASVLRGTLFGDYQSLTRFFSIDVNGSAAHWRLSLQPIKSGGLLEHIVVRGEEHTIQLIDMTMSNGDQSQMRILPW